MKTTHVRKFIKYFIYSLIVFTALLGALVFWLAQKEIPQQITYGMSFNTVYARELGLDWKETYDTAIENLLAGHESEHALTAL